MRFTRNSILTPKLNLINFISCLLFWMPYHDIILISPVFFEWHHPNQRQTKSLSFNPTIPGITTWTSLPSWPSYPKLKIWLTNQGERHELVYANLEFEKQGSGTQSSLQTQQQPMINTTNGNNRDKKQKPIPRPKPQISQRHHLNQSQPQHQSSRPAANSTEYAQIAFSNRTEL
jgi:hypothetical protein